jgi:hypothetical protein
MRCCKTGQSKSLVGPGYGALAAISLPYSRMSDSLCGRCSSLTCRRNEISTSRVRLREIVHKDTVNIYLERRSPICPSGLRSYKARNNRLPRLRHPALLLYRKCPLFMQQQSQSGYAALQSRLFGCTRLRREPGCRISVQAGAGII